MCDWGFGTVWVLYMEEMMIICQMPHSTPSLLGFWWVLHSYIYCILYSRTKGKKDFSFSGHFLSGFSHAENVFATRCCCRCITNSGKNWNTCYISTWQLLKIRVPWMPLNTLRALCFCCPVCIASCLLAFCLQKSISGGGGCSMWPIWLIVELGWSGLHTDTQKQEG